MSMWLSERKRSPGTPAAQGSACAYDGGTGVQTDGEVRSVTVCAPGGYTWRPRDGEDVILLRGEGGEVIVAGVETGSGLRPGEIRISSGAASVTLLADGSAEIYAPGGLTLRGAVSVQGALTVNGRAL